MGGVTLSQKSWLRLANIISTDWINSHLILKSMDQQGNVDMLGMQHQWAPHNKGIIQAKVEPEALNETFVNLLPLSLNFVLLQIILI